MEIHFPPTEQSLSIFIRDLEEFTDTSVTFDGQFRAEPEVLPLRHLIYIEEGARMRCRLISIESKTILEDTSKGEYDEEFGGHICLTPTNRIRITYRTLYEFKEDRSDSKIYEEISEELNKEYKEKDPLSLACRHAREAREWEAQAERMRTMDFSGLFDKSNHSRSESA